MNRSDAKDINLYKEVLFGVFATLLIFLISVGFMPVFGVLIPVPVLVLRVKLGHKGGVYTAFASAFIFILLMKSIALHPIDVIFLIGLIALGLAIAEQLEKSGSVDRIVLRSTAIVIIGGFALFFLYSMIESKGIATLFSDYMTEKLKIRLNQMEMPEKNIYEIVDFLENHKSEWIKILPAITISSVLVVSWVSVLASRMFFRRLKIRHNDIGKLNCWKAPEQLIWGLIASGVFVMLPGENIKLLGFTGIMILLTVYFFQGIAIIAYFIESKQLNPAIRFFIFGVIALMPLVQLFISGIGVFDLWLDFRKLTKKSEPL